MEIEKFTLLSKVLNEVCEEAQKHDVLSEIKDSIVCDYVLNKLTSGCLSLSQQGLLYEVLKNYIIEKIKEM
jgi:hypothetical protein